MCSGFLTCPNHIRTRHACLRKPLHLVSFLTHGYGFSDVHTHTHTRTRHSCLLNLVYFQLFLPILTHVPGLSAFVLAFAGGAAAAESGSEADGEDEVSDGDGDEQEEFEKWKVNYIVHLSAMYLWVYASRCRRDVCVS